MMKERDRRSVPRRDFLKLAGLGGVAGAVAAVSGTQGAAAAVATEGKRASGYRETAHVRKFYELSRF